MKDLTLKEHLASIASKGGKVKGKSKKRGSSSYYKALSKKAVAARKK